MLLLLFLGGKCWIGHHCPEGSAIPKPCSPGTYMNHTTSSQCYDCPPGFFCVDGIHPSPCPAGNIDVYTYDQIILSQ